jgi:hypothetical protein
VKIATKLIVVRGFREAFVFVSFVVRFVRIRGPEA